MPANKYFICNPNILIYSLITHFESSFQHCSGSILFLTGYKLDRVSELLNQYHQITLLAVPCYIHWLIDGHVIAPLLMFVYHLIDLRLQSYLAPLKPPEL